MDGFFFKQLQMITSDSDLLCDLYPKLSLSHWTKFTFDIKFCSNVRNWRKCHWLLMKTYFMCDKTLTITILKFSFCLVLSLIAVSWFFLKINLGSKRFLLIEIWERCFQMGVLFIHFNPNVSNKDWFLSASSQLCPTLWCQFMFVCVALLFLSLAFVPICL